jgi:hypothetical protein
MAGCRTFKVKVADDVTSVLNKVRSQIKSAGGKFDGDTLSGTFSGDVSVMGSFVGNYEVSGTTVTITITKKPFTIPCNSIESKIREYFR